jgi:hypothetical protein
MTEGKELTQVVLTWSTFEADDQAIRALAGEARDARYAL